jgi:hypothetical protein
MLQYYGCTYISTEISKLIFFDSLINGGLAKNLLSNMQKKLISVGLYNLFLLDLYIVSFLSRCKWGWD